MLKKNELLEAEETAKRVKDLTAKIIATPKSEIDKLPKAHRAPRTEYAKLRNKKND